MTDSEFLDDRDIPRDCEHGQLARQCEQCECQRDLAEMRSRLEKAERVAKAASDYYSCTDLARMFSTAQALSAAVSEWEAGR
jgi:hypothetical protein